MERRVKERLVGATILVVLIVLIVPELLSGPKARVTQVQPPSTAGPAEAVRNVTVDLATSKATPAENTSTENTPADNTAASAALPAESTTATGAAVPGDAASSNAASGDSTAPGEALPAESAPGEAAAGAPTLTSRANRTRGYPTIATLKAQQPAHSAEPPLESEPSTPRSASQASRSGTASATAPAGASNHHWAVQLGSFASRANAEKLVRQRKPHDDSLYVSSSGKGAALRYRVRIGPLADRDAAERVVAKLKKEGQSASLVPP
jgi:cell division septation protein DedD